MHLLSFSNVFASHTGEHRDGDDLSHPQLLLMPSHQPKALILVSDLKAALAAFEAKASFVTGPDSMTIPKLRRCLTLFTCSRTETEAFPQFRPLSSEIPGSVSC